ncbi:hypothetical protein B9Z38_05905 [Limnohabitans sp. MMS-10A-160]|uniref:type I restriction-modification system subunit M N-terminal domain-containing protein n=1 Tax=Limnohabitans sp. MMS-10A-160 TaxID=1835766 RepID=UPI000D352E97|nr:type I restriction-modification system subunit M N-terminal domain-containing protein [Limnohabitans sp. MMS-10A-160]PUE25880.1 hypothetical protein B9Z38_05905 [Limnohabitans sp. MMS-10A-160]
MTQETNNLAADLWALADLLRGDFKQSQYGRVILPFALLRRLECVLESSKSAVLVEAAKVEKMAIAEEAKEKLLLRATSGLSFFNTSPMDLSTLGESGIKANLERYIQCFSKDAREIFDHFKFAEFIGLLNDANLLYKVVQKVRTMGLHPRAVSNYEMGLVFEELIRKFAESSNETAGEHFTPRDIVHLTTSLVFMEDDEALTKPGIIRTIYDPTAGTGGFLSAGMEYVHEQNPQAVMRAFGQELNPESYAICKADMLIKGQEVSNIILDVLKNYTNYKVAYKLALKVQGADAEVESKRAKVKLNQWVRLHDHNIAQKVMVIVEHFKDNVMGLLGGQAKAMVVTSSRKEAVRYKQCFDKYIADKGYQKIRAMVAFSGEVLFTDKDPSSAGEITAGLIGEKFTESNMNPNLKGRDMRKAFDSDDYQVMIVANKFQTGFDQPKLCAMYVDKKLAGVECVQTLSRLNRTYPNKAETGTFVLDFFNDPDEILEAFQPYFQTAELLDVSDPNLIFALQDKLRAAGIFTWQEVEQFCAAFYVKNKSNAAIANICKPAVQRWQLRYKSAVEAFKIAKDMFERTQKTGDAVLIANAEKSLKECQKEKDALEIFKKDLGTFVRFYEFMSQIVDYDDTDLEKLSLYARNLRPMLRETLLDEDDIDLGNVVLSHYRVAKIRQQDLLLKENTGEYKLEPGEGLGTAKPKDKKEEYLSQIINRLNEVFVTDQLTDKDMVNYAYTIRDKVGENIKVMKQIENNSAEQALLGDFSKAIDDAILDSSDAHQNQMMQLLADPSKAANFARIVFDLLVQGQAGNR